MNWNSKNLSLEIRFAILEVKEPFLKSKLYKILGANTSERKRIVLNIFDELGKEGLIYFEKVLPENEGLKGYAFITDDVYNDIYCNDKKTLKKKKIN